MKYKIEEKIMKIIKSEKWKMKLRKKLWKFKELKYEIEKNYENLKN